jgi:predicted RNA binding protein YcfA (HicA-like mRNA interferase family)
MKVSEFIKRIKKKGVRFHSHGSRHDWYENTENGKKSQVPRHKSKELPTGTMKDILNALEIEL